MQTDNTERSLPAIRNDLALNPSAPARDGKPRWTLYDPIQHKFYQIDESAFIMLSHWRAGANAQEWLDELSRLDASDIDWHSDYDRLFEMLFRYELIEGQSTEALIENTQKQSKSLFHKVLHGYLFFKYPLLKPEPWIGHLANRLLFLRNPFLYWLTGLLGTLGLIEAISQWDRFVTTFSEFASWQGVLLYVVVLTLVKMVHEFAHALETKWHGCNVASMGVGFLVLFPILYTDSTDAWRLARRRDRFAIVTAGLKAELGLSALALFIWSIAPPGMVQSVAFVVATTALISSAMVNLSPFMRFDGYYAMSDLTGIENLQERAFSMARWFLRRTLFGLKHNAPEVLPFWIQFWMVLYAYGTWLYRFFLFIGIAILVYNIAFKALGIFLFVVEIWFFILRPITKEVSTWWEHKSDYQWTRSSVFSAVLLVAMILWAVLPLHREMRVPAIITPMAQVDVFANESGITYDVLRDAGTVNKGDVLANVKPIALTEQIIDAQNTLAANTKQLQVALSERSRLQQIDILRSQVSAAQVELDRLLEREARVTIRAPFTGYWQPNRLLSEGVTWSDSQPIGLLLNKTQWQLRAKLTELELEGLSLDDDSYTVYFVPEVGAVIHDIPRLTLRPEASREILDLPFLASGGGSIEARYIQNKWLTQEPLFLLTAEFPSKMAMAREQRGFVVLEKPTPPPIANLFQYVMNTLRSEFDF